MLFRSIISGMYTGGTLNAAALQTIFGVNGETFVLINSYDIIISFLYFVFLFSCGIKLFRKLYGEKHSTKEEISTEREKRDTPSNPYSGLWSKAGMKELGKIVGATLCIVAHHLEQVKLQLTRDPRPLPKMKINPDVKSIFDFKYEDFELCDYDPHPHIKGEVSV